jgi:hypothetical protein
MKIETRIKISKTRTILIRQGKLKINSTFKNGHPQFNISRTCFKKNHIPWNKGKHVWTNKDVIKKCLKRNCPSKLEEKMIQLINRNKLPYVFVGDGRFLLENRCPDFVNTDGQKIAVEVFYGKHKELFQGNLKEWKSERIKLFAKYGWKLLFFDEKHVNDNDVLKRL